MTALYFVDPVCNGHRGLPVGDQDDTLLALLLCQCL